MEVQLTASTQQASQLRAQVSMLESEAAAREGSSGSTAHMAELSALRSDAQCKEQELFELRLQLQSALLTSTQVLLYYHMHMNFTMHFINTYVCHHWVVRYKMHAQGRVLQQSKNRPASPQGWFSWLSSVRVCNPNSHNNNSSNKYTTTRIILPTAPVIIITIILLTVKAMTMIIVNNQDSNTILSTSVHVVMQTSQCVFRKM